MDGLTFEIVLKKFVIGCEWKDAELQREALIDLVQFAEEVFPAEEHPVTQKIAAEKSAAEEADKLQELLVQWHQEVFPYIRYPFKYLYKYFGDPEVLPLWQSYPVSFWGSLNVDIACLEQVGPLREEEVAKLIWALRESIGHEKGLNIYFDTLYEIIKNHPEKVTGSSLEG